jgi:hypothetical protein
LVVRSLLEACYRRGRRYRPPHGAEAPAREIAAQNERVAARLSIPLRIVARAAASVAKSRPSVKRPGGAVVVADLQEQRGDAALRKPRGEGVDERLPHAAAARTLGHGEGQDFRFVRGSPRGHETGRSAAAGQAGDEHHARWVRHEIREGVRIPAARERGAVQRGQRRYVGFNGRLDRDCFRPAHGPLAQTCATAAPDCGLASGARR